MKISVKKTIGLLLLLIVNVVHAGGGSNWLSITQIYSYKSGVVRVFISPSHQDPDQCGSAGHVHIAANADKNMYSTVLTAFTTGKQVSFYMSGCLTESGNSAPEVTRVAIQ